DRLTGRSASDEGVGADGNAVRVHELAGGGSLLPPGADAASGRRELQDVVALVVGDVHVAGCVCGGIAHALERASRARGDRLDDRAGGAVHVDLAVVAIGDVDQLAGD